MRCQQGVRPCPPSQKLRARPYGIIANEGGSGRIETYFHIAGGYVNAGESLSNLSAGQWYHFAATFDGTGTKFYRDGVLKQSVTKSGTLSTNNEPLTIGANPDSQGKNFMEFFSGAIDEVRVYNRALSSQEVSDLYAAANGGTPVPAAPTPLPTSTPTPPPSAPAASISTYMVVASPTSLNAGASVTATWTSPSGSSAKDWVGLYKVGDSNNSFGKWVYTGGLPSGTFTTAVPTNGGTYEFRYLLNDGYSDVARSSAITVTAAPVVVSPPAPSPTPAASGVPYDRTSPVIYDNDGAIESGFTDEYIMALASAGVIDLRGIISTGTNGEQPPYTPRSEASLVLERQEVVGKARRSGLRNIPEVSPGPGVSMSSRRPASGRIEDTVPFGSKGSWLIVTEARKATPAKPLVVVMGGQGSAVADAYLLDNSIADKVVVAWLVGRRRSSNGILDAYEYNAYVDSWATYIAFERLRVVVYPVDDAQYVASTPKSRLFELPVTEIRQYMLENRWPRGAGTYSEISEDSHDWDVMGAIALTRSDFVISTKRMSFSHWEPDSWGGPYQVPVWQEDPNGRALVVWQANAAVATDEWWSRMKDPKAWGTSAGEVPLNGTPWTVPGTIEAESFDHGGTNVAYYDNTNNWTSEALFNEFRFLEHVDLKVSAGASGGYKVVSAESGEWIKYTIAVGSTNTYTLQVGVASNGAGGTFHVEFNGVDKTGPITVPNTGGWDTWQIMTKSGIPLNAGTQVMRLVMDSNGASNQVGNFDYLKLAASSNGGTPLSSAATPVPIPTPTATIPPTSTYSLSVSPTTVNAGASVTATWAAPSGSSAKDWVGLYKVGDSNNSFGKWVYTGGLPSGTFTTAVPSTGGSYEFRYLLNDGFTGTARSSAITVTAAAVVVSPPAPSPTPAATFDFSLTNNGSKSVTQGQSAINMITATQVLNGASAQSISFSTSGLPTGATYSYAPGSCTLNCSTSITINTSSSTPTGVYTIGVTGTGGGMSRSTQFTLTVVSQGTVTSGSYYVSSGMGVGAQAAGNDDNPGTLAQPFKTLQKAISMLKAGNTLVVRGGEYDTVNGLTTYGGASIIPSGTSWANPTTLKAYSGERPVFRRYMPAGTGVDEITYRNSWHMPTYAECVANGYPDDFPHGCWSGGAGGLQEMTAYPGYGPSGYVLQMDNDVSQLMQYVVIDGIDIDARGIASTLVLWADGVQHVRFTNMEIRNSIKSCVAGHASSPAGEQILTDYQFIGVNIHGCGVPYDSNTIGAFLARKHPEARFRHPWYMHTGGNTLIGSETSDSAGTALGPAGDNNIIENNYFHDNNAGVYIDGSNWRICNNVFYNNGSIDLYHRNGRNATVCNNTIVSGPVNPSYSQWGIYLAGNSSASLYENNIIVSPIGVNNDSWGQAHTFRNNLIKKTPSWHSSYEFLEQYGVAVTKQNNILGQDPKLVNPAGGDFHLQAGSPAIDKGSPNGLTTDKDGNARPRGNGIDIGAYEFGN